jgi:hypothetical protein
MENPYQSSTHGGAPPTPTGNVTLGVVQGLAATKPWVRFCAIIGFILAGMMVLFGLIAMAGGVFAGMAGTSGKSGAMEGGVVIGLGVFYVLLAAIYLIPAIRLWKYGSSILNLMMSGSVTDLDKAMEQHRAFWKFVGILMIVGTLISILAMIGGFFAASSSIPPSP